MTDTIFALITTYGYIGVFVCAYLSCLLVPVPTSLMMLAGGALAASGDLSAPILITAAFTGAVLGDQTGYFIGRRFGRRALTRLSYNRARAKVIARAEQTVEDRGGIGVFFSTWLVAPLGPYVNVVAGAAGLKWARFTVADILGEAIWVNLYIWLGFAFAGSLTLVAELVGDVMGLIAALVIAASAALWIAHVLRAQRMADRSDASHPATDEKNAPPAPFVAGSESSI
ncbi:DedA family protein [Pacificibacter marinus]|uniref:Inner membrane protein YabI n=1 Tax=Pacificibacter marinus TaxID=658057 RepID=A0A1Y5RT81_9RHOB|nr:DedA family protein [Pacificibacter marinus]SEK41175.1 membrane protein DedA, SNARE-associated domain [Pacificibacter marinus]SLN24875.1 Inner membrane protein YabI [Pacificibacter marinus]